MAIWNRPLADRESSWTAGIPARRMSSSKKPSWRQMAVFACGALLIALADPLPATFAAGCAIVALGWLVRIWAFGHLEKNVLLVTSGPYAHSRNPAYLGSFLCLVGVALAAGNGQSNQGRLIWGLTAALIAAFFLFYLPRKFEREYERLRKHFGPAYEEHARNVPDFLPRLSPWRSGDERRFSFARVSENHEWGWGLALTGLLLAVWLAPSWSPLHGIFD